MSAQETQAVSNEGKEITRRERKKEMVWTWLGLDDETKAQIETIRENMREMMPKRVIEEEHPHVTVLPSVTIPAYKRDMLFRIFQKMDTVNGEEISINGLSFFPDPEDGAFVVKLVVDCPFIEKMRRQQMEVIKHESIDGEIVNDPVPAHITLFKFDHDSDGTFSKGQIEEIKNAVNNVETNFTATVTNEMDTY